MATIKLTHGRFALIDEVDVQGVESYRWSAVKIRKDKSEIWYAYTNDAPNRTAVGPTSLHRFIMGQPAGMEVDHINGDGLDNRRENLRLATHQQNLANQKLSKASTTGYKGVTLDQRKKKDGTSMTPTWMAQTKYNGKRVYLGKFSTPELAARAYDRKMIELHGEFARTNESLGLIPPDDGAATKQNLRRGVKD